MIQNFINNGTTVAVYIVNGCCLKGIITDVASDYIIIDNNAIVYKHAISTIRPL